MNPFRTLAISCVVLAATIAAYPAVSQSQEVQPDEIKLIKLNFSGGSAAEYVAAVKKAAAGLNVFVAPEASQVPMPAIELTGVTPSTALQLLHDRRSIVNGTIIQLQYDEVGLPTTSAGGVFNIQASVAGRSTGFTTKSQVWSVSGILSMGVKTDDMLTAIQTSLDLLEKEIPEAQIRFHEATGILIVRATVEQLGAINDVIEMLEVSASERRAGSSDDAVRQLKAAMQERELVIQQMQVRIQALEAELAAAKKK